MGYSLWNHKELKGTEHARAIFYFPNLFVLKNMLKSMLISVHKF